MDAKALPVPTRGVLRLSGPDRVGFLQGLVSNDVAAVAADRAVWAAFLTAQGKFLHEFFVVQAGESLLLVCEAARRDDLFRRLRMYKLRSKVELTDATEEFAVATVYGADAAGAFGLRAAPGAASTVEGGVGFVDPRHAELGVHLVVAREAADALLSRFHAGERAAWERVRIALGVPDGVPDLEPEKSTLLESGFDELHGVSWDKGCYMGQELTARTKYRGLVKKRLVPVAVDGPLPAPGTPVSAGEREVGEVRSGVAGLALALIRLDAMDEADLRAGDARLNVRKPHWAGF